MNTNSGKCFLGVEPSTGEVNTIAVMDASNVMECLRAGEIVIPCTTEEARQLWGKKAMAPLNLASIPKE